MMSDVTHTPGPWIAGLDSDWSIDTDSSNTYIHVGPEDGNPVCIVIQAEQWFDECDRVDADAQLISAAPDMLDELRKAEAFMAGFEGDEMQDEIDAKLATIRAAIAKATHTPAGN